MSVSKRETERLQQLAQKANKSVRGSQAKFSTQKSHPALVDEERLNQLSIPKQGPNAGSDSAVRSQQISEVVKTEHDLINTIHQSAGEIRSKLVNLLSRHLHREQRRRAEFEKVKLDLWGKVVENYLIFQKEENFPKEYHLIERVALKKLINDYYEFWLLRSTHAYTTQAMVLFSNNVDSHHDEIFGLPEDERERGILGLIDVYISPSTVVKCEAILLEFPFPTADGSGPPPPPEEEDDDEGDEDEEAKAATQKAKGAPLTAAERKRARLLRVELDKDESVGKALEDILEDVDKAVRLRDSIKTAAVVKGWENAREILDVQFAHTIESHVPEEKDEDSDDEGDEGGGAGGQ